MRESNRSRAEANVKERNVGEKNRKDYLRCEPDQALSIVETLLPDWLDACLGSDVVSHLEEDNPDKVSGLSILERFAGVTDLSISKSRISVEPRGQWWISIVPSAFWPRWGRTVNVEKSQIDGTVFVFHPLHFAVELRVAVVSVAVMRKVRVIHIAALRQISIFVVEIEERPWSESVVIHDEKVNENCSNLLDHTNLKVRKTDHLLAYKSVELRVTRLPRHNV